MTFLPLHSHWKFKSEFLEGVDDLHHYRNESQRSSSHSHEKQRIESFHRIKSSVALHEEGVFTTDFTPKWVTIMFMLRPINLP